MARGSPRWNRYARPNRRTKPTVWPRRERLLFGSGQARTSGVCRSSSCLLFDHSLFGARVPQLVARHRLHGATHAYSGEQTPCSLSSPAILSRRMSRTADIFRSIWRWWAYFCGVVVLLVICLLVLVTLKQSRKDKAFTEAQLVPLASYVEAFRDSQHRLPSDAEFQAWASTNCENKAVWYYQTKPAFMSDWGSPARDFIVGAWRGEWVQYYRSWDKKTFDGDAN